MIRAWALIAALLLCIPQQAFAGVYTIYATNDTMLDDANPSTNYGTAGTVAMHGLGNAKYIVKFDLSALTGLTASDIISAELRVYETTRGSGHNVTFARLVRSWTEVDATWTKATSSVNWATAGAGNTTSDYVTTNSASVGNQNPGWIIVDATGMLKDMITAGNDYGFVLYATTAGQAYDYLDTAENTETFEARPRLTVRTGTPGTPTEWYINLIGDHCGSGEHCNGLTNNAYPGSGVNQNCSCSQPGELIGDATHTTLPNGEDHINVASGTYTITNDLSVIPAGSTTSARTLVLGAGEEIGCPNPVIFSGSGVFNLMTVDSHTELHCLRLVDTNGCIKGRGDTPVGAVGKIDNESTQDNIHCTTNTDANSMHTGLRFIDGATDVVMQHVSIEGPNTSGIEGVRLGETWFLYSQIMGAAFVGWNGDPGAEGVDCHADPTNLKCHYVGPIHFRHSKIMYTGCGWRAKATPGGQLASTPHNCTDQTTGGYGDAFGINGQSADWDASDCEVSDNTSDGFDWTYDSNATTTKVVYRCKFEGNVGAAIKTHNNLHVEDSVLVGNCADWEHSPWTYANIEAPGRAGSNCNHDGLCNANENSTNCSDCAGYGIVPCRGNALLVAGQNTTLLYGNTYGSVQMDCIINLSGSDCSGMVFRSKDNIYHGAADYNSDDNACVFYQYGGSSGTDGNQPCPNFNSGVYDVDYNLYWNTKNGCSDKEGAHSLCMDPKFVGPLYLTSHSTNNDPMFNNHGYFESFHLQSSSPAVHAALTGLSCSGDCTKDETGFNRRTLWDMGGLEYHPTFHLKTDIWGVTQP